MILTYQQTFLYPELYHQRPGDSIEDYIRSRFMEQDEIAWLYLYGYQGEIHLPEQDRYNVKIYQYRISVPDAFYVLMLLKWSDNPKRSIESALCH